jgi:TetR/AcrR family transcriptional repressor of nem operon
MSAVRKHDLAATKIAAQQTEQRAIKSAFAGATVRDHEQAPAGRVGNPRMAAFVTDRSIWVLTDRSRLRMVQEYMARPRGFDDHEVLDRAVGVFWRRGYEGTSIADVVDAVGVQRQSLYNVFTDKHGIFVAALARYRDRVIDTLAPLAAPDAGLAALRVYMLGVLDRLRTEGGGGCLLVKAALGPESAHADVLAAVRAGADAVRAAFARVLTAARETGQIAASTDPDAAAGYLYAVLHGLAALVRTGGDPSHVAEDIDRALASLDIAVESPGGAATRRRRTRRRRTR